MFFLNQPATAEISTLSLHDALPICRNRRRLRQGKSLGRGRHRCRRWLGRRASHPRQIVAVDERIGKRPERSEEHTSELQSRLHLVCRLLLEKKKKLNSSTTSRYPAQ